MTFTFFAQNLLKSKLLIAEVGALITQIDLKISFYSWGANNFSKSESRHRYLGWISVIALMGLLFWGGYDPNMSPAIADLLIFLHIPLLLICSVAILYKSLKDQSNQVSNDGVLILSWIVMLVLGALFTLAVCVLLIQKFELFPASLSIAYLIPYPSLVVAHAGLGFGIILIRNLQVRRLQRNSQIRTEVAKNPKHQFGN